MCLVCTNESNHKEFQKQTICDNKMFVTIWELKSHGKVTVGQILVDYVGLPKHALKTAKIFSALPSYDQHTAKAVCPHPVKREHHREVYSSIWNSIRNCDFNSDPKDFLLRRLSSLCVICTTFLCAKGMLVCKNGKFVSNCWQLMERKKAAFV